MRYYFYKLLGRVIYIAMVEDIENGFKLNGNLNKALNKHNCKIIFDDYDGEWNRVTDIEDDKGKKYHFLNGVYDDSWED
jgi:hypothetical protein